jgi:hypothetical protein
LLEEQDGVLHAVHSLSGLRLIDGWAKIRLAIAWKPNHLNFGVPLRAARSKMAAALNPFLVQYAEIFREQFSLWVSALRAGARPLRLFCLGERLLLFEIFRLRQYVVELRCHGLLHRTLCG